MTPTCNSLYSYEIGLQFTATGAVSVTASSNSVAGSGTLFTTEFQAGYLIRVGGEWRVVSAVINNTLLQVSANWTVNASGVAAVGVTLRNVETLAADFPAPRGEYEPWSGAVKLGNALYRAVGRPRATWTWDFLRLTWRDVLNSYCLGKSNQVYIRTKVNQSDAYSYFSANMLWPDGKESRVNGRRLNFAVNFEFLTLIQVS